MAQELHKPVIKKFLRSKIYARFKDNIWNANLVEVGLLSSFNRGFKSLLRVIDIFTKYVWVMPLYNKISKTFLDNFIEIVKERKCKPNKLWTEWGKEFYNSFMQKWLGENDILMHLTHDEGK